MEELTYVRKDIIAALKKGCLPLAKWCSNAWGSDGNVGIALDDAEQTKILGLRWIPHQNVITYQIKPMPSREKWTKRQVISQIGQLFDPNGLAAPAIITAKVLIQELWKIQIDWDDHIPEEQNQLWKNYLGQLENMEIKIPRWLGTKTGWYTELHFFSDASEKAYGTCVYIRTVTEDGNITTALLQSKTKVAPIKITTIPRLEL